MTRAFYNDIDKYCCQWLRNLIEAGELSPGHVEERSVLDVQAKDLEGYVQCHFFAGIGGWPLALRLAGWRPDAPVWTASLPCQPLSCAGKQLGDRDERHLWPVFYRLVRECAPSVIFGEQVASKDGLEWLDGIFADLEDAHYACGAANLCSPCVGAPHIRSRLYWVANADGGSSIAANGHATKRGRPRDTEQTGMGGCVDGLADSENANWRNQSQCRSDAHVWGCYRLVHCRDGKSRRISAQPGDEPLAARLPRSLGPGSTREQRMELVAAKANRVGRLRGYGNAIVPQVAAEFVRAFMETIQ